MVLRAGLDVLEKMIFLSLPGCETLTVKTVVRSCTDFSASTEKLKKCLPRNSVETVSVHCHFPAYCHICHTQYMLLTHADDFMPQQLHTAAHLYIFFRSFKLFI